MKIVKMFVLFLFVVIGLLLIYVVMWLNEFVVECSMCIDVLFEKVFVLIVDVKVFNSWNFWLCKELSVQFIYSGFGISGFGVSYSWVGKESGEGSMMLIEQMFFSSVIYWFDFMKFFEVYNCVLFILMFDGVGICVSWKMDGFVFYIIKLMGVLFDMDKMVGDDFVVGLVNLKVVVEFVKQEY